MLTTVNGVFRFVSVNPAKESYVIRTPAVTIGVRGTVFSLATGADGTSVVIFECSRCSFRWQPQKRRQCLQQHHASITVQSHTGKLVTLDKCGLSTTVFPDDGDPSRPAAGLGRRLAPAA